MNNIPVIQFGIPHTETCFNSQQLKVSIPSYHSIQFYDFLDELICSIIDFINNENQKINLKGFKDVDLLEACRISFFNDFKDVFYPWWALKLAKESGLGRIFRIEKDGLTNVNIAELKDIGNFLGFELLVNPEVENIRNAKSRKTFSLSRMVNRLFFKFTKITRKYSSLSMPESVRKHRILYEDNYSNNIQILLPVYRYFQKDESVEQLYVAVSQKVKKALASEGIDAYDVSQYVLLPKDLQKNFGQFLLQLQNVINKWAQDEQVFIEIVLSDDLLKKITDIIYKRLGYAYQLSVRVKEIFNKYQPTCLVVSTSASIDARIFELFARKFGIRSVCLQHGRYSETAPTKYLLSQQTCVWGKYHKDLLEMYSGAGGEICVTGSPKHDMLLRRYSVKKSGQIMVLFASTPKGFGSSLSVLEYLATIDEIIKTSLELPKVNFIIKLHPSENYDELRRYVRNMGGRGNLLVVRDADVYDLIAQCDVFIVVNSTTGFEALLFGKAIIILNLTQKPTLLPFTESDGVITVANKGVLGKEIEMLIDKKKTRKPEMDRYWLTDGLALERCGNVIKGEKNATS